MTPSRCIVHLDMDSFFASDEVKERPALRGRPVVVGGTGRRGVVSSASYEARAFGVHSAMPVPQARRLCPQAVFLPPNFTLYHGYSERLHTILRTVTPLVEGIGLDEAFLDVSACRALFGAPVQIAAELRRRVAEDLGIDCSVGVGPNKLVAKLASKAAKPTACRDGTLPGPGVVVVTEDQVLGFLWPMPVGAMWGVGPASAERLRNLGVGTVSELAALPRSTLVSSLGKSAGTALYDLAWGRDPRPVEPGREVKSIGQEETYPTDVTDREELERRVVMMSSVVAGKVREHGFVAKTVTLKLRYGDFTTLTRSRTFPSPQSTGPALWEAAKSLLAELDLRDGARLLGVSASGLLPVERAPGEQLRLDLTSVARTGTRWAGSAALAASAPAAGMQVGKEPVGREPVGREPVGKGGPVKDRSQWERVSKAVDAVHARFGEDALRPAVAAKSSQRPGGSGQGQLP